MVGVGYNLCFCRRIIRDGLTEKDFELRPEEGESTIHKGTVHQAGSARAEATWLASSGTAVRPVWLEQSE